MQGQSLQKKTQFSITMNPTLQCTRCTIVKEPKFAEAALCSNLLHDYFLAKLNLVWEFEQECLVLNSILG
jgi:hypothetical protein